MLRDLLGIRHESVKLACTVLTMSPLQACTPGSFHLRMDPPTPSSGSAPHLILHVVHLAYLDEIQNASA
jgi:hypothetical protein